MQKVIARVLLGVAIASGALLLYASWRPRGDDQRALTQMGRLNAGLDIFEVTTGRPPTAEEGLRALVSASVIPDVPKDPWNREYVYDGDTAWRVRTLGEDGLANTGDDLRATDKPRRTWMNPFVLY